MCVRSNSNKRSVTDESLMSHLSLVVIDIYKRFQVVVETGQGVQISWYH